MATELGRYLRRLRIDNDELLKQMAVRLEVASSTLSSIESGRRTPPRGFIERLVNEYRISGDSARDLQDALLKSREEIPLRIKELSSNDQNLAVAFARKFSSLSDDQKDRLRRILEED